MKYVHLRYYTQGQQSHKQTKCWLAVTKLKNGEMFLFLILIYYGLILDKRLISSSSFCLPPWFWLILDNLKLCHSEFKGWRNQDTLCPSSSCKWDWQRTSIIKLMNIDQASSILFLFDILREPEKCTSGWTSRMLLPLFNHQINMCLMIK